MPMLGVLKALHRTAIPLRSIAAGELGCCAPKKIQIDKRCRCNYNVII